MIVAPGDLLKLDLGIGRPGYYKVVSGLWNIAEHCGELQVDGPYLDATCAVRVYGDVTGALSSFHPDSFALKADDKDAT